jgi:para-nitrobenzyl esterase
VIVWQHGAMMASRCARACAALLLAFASACGDDSIDAPAGAGASGTGPGAGGGGGDGTLVATDRGSVQGSVAGKTRVFLGIPFAAPPVGDLRWKAPQPAAAWSDVLAATARGPACAQLGALSPKFDSSSSEDCLTLNIWAPAAAGASAAPVLVWIHGGTFLIGSGGEAAYDGQRLSEATGAVVVTINYRLGPLGFLAHPQLKAEDPAYPSSGMYGFEDQRAALAWTRDNIGAFGGDPANVTVFGESAGGFSTCYHLVSPKSAGLFHRAIIESGACASGRTATEVAAEAQGQKLAETLGCDGADGLSCLRGKPADEVLLALPSGAADILGDVRWGPVIDGLNLPDDPRVLLEAGEMADVPTLLGTNANEGTLFFALGSTKVPDDDAYLALVEALAPGHGEEILAEYPSRVYGSPQAAAAASLGDVVFVCPARRTARALAKAGIPAWLYHFTHAPSRALLPDLGAFHSAEIPFVFGNPSALLPNTPTEEEAPLFAAMTGYWGRMSRTGDPNGDGAFEWPAYAASTDENIVLDLTLSKQGGLRAAQCDFWDALGL